MRNHLVIIEVVTEFGQMVCIDFVNDIIDYGL